MGTVENLPRSSRGLAPTAPVRGLRFVAKHKRELDGSLAAGFCGARARVLSMTTFPIIAEDAALTVRRRSLCNEINVPFE